MPTPFPPESLSELLAWIGGADPYHKIDHSTSKFPDLNAFLIHELATTLLQAVKNVQTARERLRKIPGPAQAFAGLAELAANSRILVLTIDTSGMLSLSRRDAACLAIAAKYQGCMSYQNLLVALAISAGKLKKEAQKVKAAVAKYQREVQAREMLMGMLTSSHSSSPTSMASNGDDDDWFVVGSEASTPGLTPDLSKERKGSKWGNDAQEKLYEEIEVRLAGVGMREGEVLGQDRSTGYLAVEKGEEERARQGTIMVAIDDVAPYYYDTPGLGATV